LQLSWLDDEGKMHTFKILNSYYILHGNVHLLSLQHWAQTRQDKKPLNGTGEFTDDEQCVLYWDQKQYRLTIPLDKCRSIVATMQLAPGYGKFT